MIRGHLDVLIFFPRNGLMVHNFLLFVAWTGYWYPQKEIIASNIKSLFPGLRMHKINFVKEWNENLCREEEGRESLSHFQSFLALYKHHPSIFMNHLSLSSMFLFYLRFYSDFSFIFHCIIHTHSLSYCLFLCLCSCSLVRLIFLNF